MLQPKTALTLSLITHELATNAAKYGALSGETGRVEVRWLVGGEEGRQHLRIEWREHGGPRVQIPSEKGFGTRLIERSAAYELDGRADLTFAPEGVRMYLSLPLS